MYVFHLRIPAYRAALEGFCLVIHCPGDESHTPNLEFGGMWRSASPIFWESNILEMKPQRWKKMAGAIEQLDKATRKTQKCWWPVDSQKDIDKGIFTRAIITWQVTLCKKSRDPGTEVTTHHAMVEISREILDYPLWLWPQSYMFSSCPYFPSYLSSCHNPPLISYL